MAQCKTAVTPVHQQWSYCSLALSHWYHIPLWPNGVLLQKISNSSASAMGAWFASLIMVQQALWTLYIHALLVCLSTLLYVYGTQIWGGVCPRELPKAGINIYTPPTGPGVITFPYSRYSFIAESNVFMGFIRQRLRCVINFPYVSYTFMTKCNMLMGFIRT